MNIEEYIIKQKEFQNSLLDFLEEEDSSDDKFQPIIDIITELNILTNKDEFLQALRLIFKISENHKRTPNFFNKLRKLFHYLIKDITLSPITNGELYQMFENNKSVLLLLFEEGILIPDEPILRFLLKQKDLNGFKNYYFFYGGIKKYLGKRKRKRFEYEIQQTFGMDVDTFIKKCQEGENDSYLAQLIRSDSIDDFISHVNRTNISLNSEIKGSFFDTNTFLIGKDPSLIEYAVFFGSIRIINYLKNNNVQLSSSFWKKKRFLWPYAVHSNNPEVIALLEESDTFFNNELYGQILIESIKCHHNEIAQYINENFLNNLEKRKFRLKFSSAITSSLNYYFYPDEFVDLIDSFSVNYLFPYLTSIIIPSSITSIGSYFFKGCSKLKEIIIPSSVTLLGYMAFNECSSLNLISIPSSVEFIGSDLFGEIKELEIIGDMKFISNCMFNECSSLTKLTIPSSVTSIGEKSFCKCKSLKELTIPSSVNSIEKSAFMKCSLLEKINIPSKITKINESTFYKCKNLKEILIPNSVVSIEKKAFYFCLSLSEIEIPSSVKSIGKKAFYNCSALKKITFPNSLIEIGKSAFYECVSLVGIEIPSSVTEIKDFTFYGCSSLKDIVFHSSLESIGNYAFYGCSSLKEIDLLSKLTLINDDCFNNCISLEKISLPSTLKSIGINAFYNCSSLNEISFPNSLEKIDQYSFYNCSSLKEISLPSSLISIKPNAFFGCSSLKKISIPSSVKVDDLTTFPSDAEIKRF